MAADLGPGSALSRRPIWRWALWAGAGVLIAAVVIGGGVVTWLWWSFRPIDHTEPHGDACLAERQGENFRCWDLFVPEQVADRPLPLVVDLHGFLNPPAQQRRMSGFDRLAAEEGFVVAWPYGIKWSWNAGGEPWRSDYGLAEAPGTGCCGHALNNDIDDVGFIRDLVAALVGAYDIDENRIFLTGYSNGCFMAQRIAGEASDVFDAVACMAGYAAIDEADDYRPVPILEIHGTSDRIVDYEPEDWQGAVANFEEWRARNGCTDEPAEVWRRGEHTMIRSDECADGADVALATLVGVGHLIYAGQNEADVDPAELAWDFFASVS